MSKMFKLHRKFGKFGQTSWIAGGRSADWNDLEWEGRSFLPRFCYPSVLNCRLVGSRLDSRFRILRGYRIQKKAFAIPIRVQVHVQIVGRSLKS